MHLKDFKQFPADAKIRNTDISVWFECNASTSFRSVRNNACLQRGPYCTLCSRLMQVKKRTASMDEKDFICGIPGDDCNAVIGQMEIIETENDGY